MQIIAAVQGFRTPNGWCSSRQGGTARLKLIQIRGFAGDTALEPFSPYKSEGKTGFLTRISQSTSYSRISYTLKEIIALSRRCAQTRQMIQYKRNCLILR